MNRLGLACVFAGVFAASLAAVMPLGAALALARAGETGLSARAVSGSIWHGRLDDMRLGRLRFGIVEARLEPLAMLTGGRHLRLQSREGRAILVTGRVQGLDGADAVIDIAALGLALPVEGVMRLQGATVLFEDRRCLRAEGRLIADIVHGTWKGLTLAGELACEAGIAVARLSGRSAEAEVALAFSIDSDARYRLHARVASADAALRLGLSLIGFTQSEGGMERSDQGRLGT